MKSKCPSPCDFVVCGSVRISASALWQSDGKRKILEIKQTALSEWTLQCGSPEDRPWVSLLLGLVLAGPGFWLANSMWGGGHILLGNLRYEFAIFLFFGIGVWLVYGALAKRRYFLRANGSGDSRKLVFDSKKNLSEIRQFLLDARDPYGFTFLDLTIGAIPDPAANPSPKKP